MARRPPVRIMVWCAARGGMRSVVEAYRDDGFLAAENVVLIASYVDGGFARRQAVLLVALVRFTWALLTRRVTLVHCHAAMRGSFWRKGLFASLARLFGVPVLLHLHGSEMQPFYLALPRPLQALVRRHLEAATRVLVLSESWASFVQSIAPRAVVAVVPNHVRLPAPTAPADRDNGPVLFLGLVGRRKGVWELIPAFARAHRDRPTARLVIGGNGEVDRAAALIRSHRIVDAVTLAGWIDGSAKAALLATASIYVLPSHNEGLPMSVLEAMAAGLPVVTTRVGGLPELITDGVDGMLVDAGDEVALAAALERLLADPASRHRLGTAARARIEAHYSDTVLLPLLRELYREAEIVKSPTFNQA